MKTPITFDSTLISPAGLRTAAAEARSKRDEMDGVSASHFVLWHNLASALDDEADRMAQLDEKPGPAS